MPTPDPLLPMRLVLFPLLALTLAIAVAHAQSISDNLPGGYDGSGVTVIPPDTPATPAAPQPAPAPAPGADPYTVADVNADVTADHAGHARDQALMQAERIAFTQLCARFNIPDSAAKLNDDAIASLVQSFDLQSEKLSAVRYIGVFTIHFKAAALQKKFGKYLAASADNSGNPNNDAAAKPAGPVAHLTIAMQTESLAAWAQLKRRLLAVPSVARVDTIDLGRGISHMDLVYSGTLDDLENAVTLQGFTLRQNASGDWELNDGSMVPR